MEMGFKNQQKTNKNWIITESKNIVNIYQSNNCYKNFYQQRQNYNRNLTNSNKNHNIDNWRNYGQRCDNHHRQKLSAKERAF